MPGLTERFRRHLRDTGLILPGSGVLVGLSGGGDSVALLRLLLSLAPDLELDLAGAHVDHRIRPESASDRDFCERLCESIGIPLFTEEVDVPLLARRRGISLEAAGREVRYDFFQRTAGQRLVATAHTQDDQAETVLMRAIEGCGPGGLAGIHPRLGTSVVRPLLGFRRAELRAYLQEVGQSWLDDPSNRSATQPRARIRNSLMASLEQLNPRVVEALGRVAENCLEDDRLLQEQARLFLLQLPSPDELPVELIEVPPAVRRRVLLRACRKLAGRGPRLERVHLEQLEELLQGPPGKWRPLPGGMRAERTRTGLRLEPDVGPQPLPPPVTLPVASAVHRPEGWNLQLRLKLHEGPVAGDQQAWRVFLDASRLPKSLTLRTRLPGDRLRPFRGGGGRKLKKLLQEAGIPRRQRDRIPLLVDCLNRIVWVVGLCPDGRFVAGPESPRVLELDARKD